MQIRIAHQVAFGAGRPEVSGSRCELSAPVVDGCTWPAVIAGRVPAAQSIDNLVARCGLLLLPEPAVCAGRGNRTIEDFSHRTSCDALAVCVNWHCRSPRPSNRASGWGRVGHRPAPDQLRGQRRSARTRWCHALAGVEHQGSVFGPNLDMRGSRTSSMCHHSRTRDVAGSGQAARLLEADGFLACEPCCGEHHCDHSLCVGPREGVPDRHGGKGSGTSLVRVAAAILPRAEDGTAADKQW